MKEDEEKEDGLNGSKSEREKEKDGEWRREEGEREKDGEREDDPCWCMFVCLWFSNSGRS